MNNINFKDYFWDKCDDLHKRFLLKNNDMGNILEIFSKLQIALSDFSNTINNIIIKDYQLFPEQSTTQNEAIEYLKYILTIQTTQFNIAIEVIKNSVIIPLKAKKEDNFKKEKILFAEFKRATAKYNDSLINMKKAKEKYFQTANFAEMSTKSAKAISLKKLNNDIDKDKTHLTLSNLLEQKSTESIIEAKKNGDRYAELVKEANNNRENYIQKQYEMLQFYNDTEISDANTYKDFLLDYLTHLKTENSIIKENLIEMEEKISLININKDIKLLIKKYASDKKPELPIEYEYYVPTTDINKCYKDIDYNICYNTIMALKSHLNILPEFDVELETKKQELREICKVFFSLNINYDESLKQKLMDILHEEWSHQLFLIILSKQRTNGRYCRTQKLINDLAMILNLIIDLSYKSLCYDSVKSCIILGQTFYYEDNNKNKVYLYNFIKKNKWLRTPDFWRNIIGIMIVNEIKNTEKNNATEITKEGKDNIVFSQLLSYSTSMRDFNIDQRVIIKITDEYLTKYEVPKECGRVVYNVFGDEKYIEQLRNEYLSMPDLEQKILEEIEKEEKEKEKEKEKEQKEQVEEKEKTNNENNNESNINDTEKNENIKNEDNNKINIINDKESNKENEKNIDEGNSNNNNNNNKDNIIDENNNHNIINDINENEIKKDIIQNDNNIKKEEEV